VPTGACLFPCFRWAFLLFSVFFLLPCLLSGPEDHFDSSDWSRHVFRFFGLSYSFTAFRLCSDGFVLRVLPSGWAWAIAAGGGSTFGGGDGGMFMICPGFSFFFWGGRVLFFCEYFLSFQATVVRCLFAKRVTFSRTVWIFSFF